MLVWFAYAGIVVMTLSYSSSIAFTIFWKGLGACYLLLALGAFYGAHAIYYQIPHRVAKFVQGYFVAIIFYTMAQIVFIIVMQIAVSAAIANAKAQCEKASKGTNINCDAYTGSYSYPIVSWLIPFAIGSLWQ
ncbi:4916_t:CDS:2, partial [Gigaspora margarita]